MEDQAIKNSARFVLQRNVSKRIERMLLQGIKRFFRRQTTASVTYTLDLCDDDRALLRRTNGGMREDRSIVIDRFDAASQRSVALRATEAPCRE